MDIELGRVLRYRTRDVHPAHPNPKHRLGRELLHLSTGSFRAGRFQGAPTHLAQPGTTLPDRATRLAGALPADRRDPHRSARTGARCPPRLETHAQRIAAQLLARAGAPGEGPDIQRVDVDSLALIRPRSVGVEHVGLWAMDQLALRTRLQELPVPASLGAAALGSVIARMARPGSERATRRWLGERSALGELLGVDFETMGALQLYRVKRRPIVPPDRRAILPPPVGLGGLIHALSTAHIPQ